MVSDLWFNSEALGDIFFNFLNSKKLIYLLPIEISKYIKLMKHKFNLSLSELSKVRGSSHSPCHG